MYVYRQNILLIVFEALDPHAGRQHGPVIKIPQPPFLAVVGFAFTGESDDIVFDFP